MKFSDELLELTRAMQNAGAKPYLVGGAIRDILSKQNTKDIDLEIFNIKSEKLLPILKKFGKVSQVGKSFGVYLLQTKDETYDISLPRRESKIAEGHRGFIIESDPTMTPKDAASRRDFTINAMMYDFSTNEILDFYGGSEDFKNKILRHVSSAFSEDPLRVLRGFQFASRFGMKLHPDTAKLCRELKAEYKNLPKERIWEEWFKWATKSLNPSFGIKYLVDSGWIDFYPEIKNLQDCPQNPEWHPEGDVFIHTCHVVDAAVEIANRENLWGKIIEKEKPENRRLGLDRAQLLLSALCHDFGKPEATVWAPDGQATPGSECWRSPAHDKKGVVPTTQFLTNIGCPKILITRIQLMVRDHLAHIGGITKRAVKRLAVRLSPVTIREIAWLMEADASGRPPEPKKIPENAMVMLEIAASQNIETSKPIPLVTGKLLLQLKLYEPGPKMGQVLKTAFEAQLNGNFSTASEGIEWIKNN